MARVASLLEVTSRTLRRYDTIRRLWGHWSRGKLLRNLMWRFDWHCGQMPGSVAHERVVAGSKFVMHITLVTLSQWGFTRVVSVLGKAR